MSGRKTRYPALALALLLAAVGCSDTPKLNEPLDAEKVVTPRSPTPAAQPQPADEPAASPAETD